MNKIERLGLIEVSRRLNTDWHACRNGSGSRVWHRLDPWDWAPMTEAEAAVLDELDAPEDDT